MAEATTRRDRPYHHGNLAEALVAAGLELARTGGPDAIGLREVTRAAGVSPNAAYRHFTDRGALVHAVAVRGQHEVAAVMGTRLAAVGTVTDPAGRALARLHAIGLGYVDFAVAEPGLFQLVFAAAEQFGPDGPAPSEAPPFQLLSAALDELVAQGVLDPARRVDAEWPCWSAVHGLADLITRGPLFGRPKAEVDHLARLVVDRIVTGVIGSARPAP